MWSALALAAAIGAGQDSAEYKVMTYNIRYGTAPDREDAWPKRKGAVIALIKSHDPDVLGVQEALAEQVDELRRAMRSHAVVGVGRDDGIRKGEHSVIFYRRGMFGLREGGTRWVSGTPEQPGSLGPGARLPRIFSWGEFFTSAGGRLLVLNAHLDHQSADARLLGAQQMRSFADARSVPSVVVGDFNCTFGDAPVEHMLSGGRFFAAKPIERPMGTGNGFDPEATGGAMIDLVFVSPEFEVVDVLIDRTLTAAGRVPSDHFPVVARVRLR